MESVRPPPKFRRWWESYRYRNSSPLWELLSFARAPSGLRRPASPGEPKRFGRAPPSLKVAFGLAAALGWLTDLAGNARRQECTTPARRRKTTRFCAWLRSPRWHARNMPALSVGFALWGGEAEGWPFPPQR